jgi:SPP1 family predicted phage head-tail adaptor
LGGVSDDFFGQNNVDFSTLSNVWAKVEERSGNEAERGNQIVATKRVDFIIRYKSNLNEQMRIVYRGNTYKIQSIINEDARKAFMRITTEITD